mmetsp:Transcript_5697/g.13215  ORF Transcript_5697/g.13215 Transcript_5697/m.13215 type:complete len:138 (-) Transcript_5697:186-599(-)
MGMIAQDFFLPLSALHCPRHHCRGCGALVCASCSPFKIPVHGLRPGKVHRACQDCHLAYQTTPTIQWGCRSSLGQPPAEAAPTLTLFRDLPTTSPALLTSASLESPAEGSPKATGGTRKLAPHPRPATPSRAFSDEP